MADLQERFGVGRVTDECGSWGNNDSKLFAASYRDVRPDFCNDYTGFLAAAPVQDSR